MHQFLAAFNPTWFIRSVAAAVWLSEGGREGGDHGHVHGDPTFSRVEPCNFYSSASY